MTRAQRSFAPVPSSEAARHRMRRTPSKDTPCERAVRSCLHKLGLRYAVHKRVLNMMRTADIIFSRARVAVFVDGCFWHGCPIHGTTPKANREWWSNKIRSNKARDLDTINRLESEGWIALRIW